MPTAAALGADEPRRGQGEVARAGADVEDAVAGADAGAGEDGAVAPSDEAPGEEVVEAAAVDDDAGTLWVRVAHGVPSVGKSWS